MDGSRSEPGSDAGAGAEIGERSGGAAAPVAEDAGAVVSAPGDLGRRIGYVLKRAQASLHSRMDARLRPLGLTVPQYVCLQNLRLRPGQTSAELARAGFVTAQSMHSVVTGLQARGLVTRPASAPSGRRLPIELTDEGEGLLGEADERVREIERSMLDALGAPGAEQLLDGLGALVRVLDDEG